MTLAERRLVMIEAVVNSIISSFIDSSKNSIYLESIRHQVFLFWWMEQPPQTNPLRWVFFPGGCRRLFILLLVPLTDFLKKVGRDTAKNTYYQTDCSLVTWFSKKRQGSRLCGKTWFRGRTWLCRWSSLLSTHFPTQWNIQYAEDVVVQENKKITESVEVVISEETKTPDKMNIMQHPILRG